MLKYILLVFLFTFQLFAKDIYEIKYNGIKVGDIHNLSTIKDGYLKAEATTYLKFFVWYDYLFIYDESYVVSKEEKDTKYKKDTNHILDLLKELEISKPTYKVLDRKKILLKIECRDEVCNYTRINKKTNTLATGFISFKNGKLYEINDEDSGLVIHLK